MKPLPRNRVLIVDDSAIVRQRLLALISGLPNIEVVGEAEMALDAIEAARRLNPHAVVLDISMPGGSGMHVLETLKRQPAAPMVIMFSNFAHEPYRAKCRELGADYFFDKSTEFEKVIAVLSSLPPPVQPPSRKRRLPSLLV